MVVEKKDGKMEWNFEGESHMEDNMEVKEDNVEGKKGGKGGHERTDRIKREVEHRRQAQWSKIEGKHGEDKWKTIWRVKRCENGAQRWVDGQEKNEEKGEKYFIQKRFFFK